MAPTREDAFKAFDHFVALVRVHGRFGSGRDAQRRSPVRAKRILC